MDAYAAIILGGLVALIVVVLALGFFYPGSGAEQLGWGSSRERHEAKAVGEADDLAQLLEATNARRRARGERELTVSEIEDQEFGPGL